MARATSKTTSAATSRFRTAKSKLPRIVKIAQQLGRRIPVDELRSGPKDLSDHIDHYVYGTPKR